MTSRNFRSLGLALLMLPATLAAAHAERLVLDNGLEVKGYIIGNEGGFYLVRIGKYTKRVPESQVKSIVDDNAPAPVQTQQAVPAAAQAAPASAAGMDAAALQSLLSGLNSGGGGGGGGALDITKLLGAAGGGGGGGGLDLSQLLGGGAATGGAGGVLALAEKMKEPAFQQQFLAHIEEMNAHGPNPGAATPYITMLKGLFAQLNTAGGGHGPKPAGR